MESVDQLLNNFYDIIIVGAGTAGCVLASRLSEVPTLRILLIEAGSDHSNEDVIRIPGLSSDLQGHAHYDWRFVSETEKELNGRAIRHPRGKLVGGSSAINSHALIYPSRVFFDAWRDFGNPGWDWKSLQPYFQKFQTVDLPSPELQEAFHTEEASSADLPTSGPIHAAYPWTSNPWREAWIGAHEEIGAPSSGRGYLGNSNGGGITTVAVERETRERSHAGIYYSQAKNRPNLFLASSTLAERVVFDTTNDPPRASGVQVVHEGKRYVVTCSGEVILCSGAFQSPQLLELSGIGERSRLEHVGIDVLHDNPRVGEGLQDHLNCSIAIETHDTNEPVLSDEEERAIYDKSRTGPLADAPQSFAYRPLFPSLDSQSREALSNLLNSHAPTATNPSYPSEKLEYDFIRSMIEDPIEASATTLMVRGRRLPPDADRKLHADSRKYFTFIAMLAYPLSRGHVHVRSSSATEHPEIKFNYLSHPLDAQVLAYHLLAFEKLLDTPAMRKVTKEGGLRHTAGNNIDEAIKYLRAMARTNYHPCGTCAMMSKELGGVVNERFKVYGVQGLRVVDASVFPLITRGNVLATVYAVAERAGDVIKEDYAGVR